MPQWSPFIFFSSFFVYAGDLEPIAYHNESSDDEDRNTIDLNNLDTISFKPLYPDFHEAFVNNFTGQKKGLIIASRKELIYEKRTEKYKKSLFRREHKLITVKKKVHKCPLCNFHCSKRDLTQLLRHFTNGHQLTFKRKVICVGPTAMQEMWEICNGSCLSQEN